MPNSPLFTDAGKEVPNTFNVDQRRIPVRRDDHAIWIDIADSLVHIRAALEHINARVSAGESRSSASVKDSARGYDIDVKSYADGLLPEALDEAIREYARAKRELDALKANEWRQTVESVQAKRVVAP